MCSKNRKTPHNHAFAAQRKKPLPLKSADEEASNHVAENRRLPSYLHGLHGTRLHPRLWRIHLYLSGNEDFCPTLKLDKNTIYVQLLSAFPAKFLPTFLSICISEFFLRPSWDIDR